MLAEPSTDAVPYLNVLIQEAISAAAVTDTAPQPRICSAKVDHEGAEIRPQSSIRLLLAVVDSRRTVGTNTIE